jgi:hypothetical protein
MVHLVGSQTSALFAGGGIHQSQLPQKNGQAMLLQQEQ